MMLNILRCIFKSVVTVCRKTAKRQPNQTKSLFTKQTFFRTKQMRTSPLGYGFLSTLSHSCNWPDFPLFVFFFVSFFSVHFHQIIFSIFIEYNNITILNVFVTLFSLINIYSMAEMNMSPSIQWTVIRWRNHCRLNMMAGMYIHEAVILWAKIQLCEYKPKTDSKQPKFWNYKHLIKWQKNNSKRIQPHDNTRNWLATHQTIHFNRLNITLVKFIEIIMS